MTLKTILSYGEARKFRACKRYTGRRRLSVVISKLESGKRTASMMGLVGKREVQKPVGVKKALERRKEEGGSEGRSASGTDAHASRHLLKRARGTDYWGTRARKRRRRALNEMGTTFHALKACSKLSARPKSRGSKGKQSGNTKYGHRSGAKGDGKKDQLPVRIMTTTALTYATAVWSRNRCQRQGLGPTQKKGRPLKKEKSTRTHLGPGVGEGAESGCHKKHLIHHQLEEYRRARRVKVQRENGKETSKLRKSGGSSKPN